MSHAQSCHAVRPVIVIGWRAALTRISVPLLALLLPVLLLAPVISAPAQPTGEIAYGQGVLWRVEGAAAAPSYILGTIHVTDQRVHDLPAPVKTVLEGVDSLTIEVQLDAAASLAMAGAMMLGGGEGLDALLGAEDFARLSAITADYGVPAGMLARLAPWGAATLIALPPHEFDRMAAGEPVLDARLQAMAEARGIPVHALESIEEQIDTLSGLPQHHQLAMLRQVIALHSDLDALFETMITLYLQRDIAGVQARLVDQSAGDHDALLEAFLDRMVYDRNVRMVERMAPRLAEGNALIAVGALHLPDDRGILALLAADGYDIARVY